MAKKSKQVLHNVSSIEFNNDDVKVEVNGKQYVLDSVKVFHKDLLGILDNTSLPIDKRRAALAETIKQVLIYKIGEGLKINKRSIQDKIPCDISQVSNLQKVA